MIRNNLFHAIYVHAQPGSFYYFNLRANLFHYLDNLWHADGTTLHDYATNSNCYNALYVSVQHKLLHLSNCAHDILRRANADRLRRNTPSLLVLHFL